MIKGKTESGFEFAIDEKVAQDYRFLELLSETEDDQLKFPKVLTMLLGKEQKDRLLKHLEDKDGRVSVFDVEKALTEIFTSAKKLKK